MSDDPHAERSKLLNRQKKERTELEKDVKKKKGALKEAAQAKLDELDEQHAAELKEFDSSHKTGGGGGGGYASSKPPEAPAPPEEKPASSSKKGDSSIRERNWSGLSKKELEEECTKRGIGKKGSKEELVVKLTCYHVQTKSSEASEAPPNKPEKEDEPESEDDDEDEEEEDDEEEEEDPAAAKDPDEAEKQFKREQAVGKAIKLLLTKHFPDGFKLDELPEKLSSVNVKNFSPQICGYSTLDRFVRKQPEKILRYKKSAQMILPPKK